MAEEGNRASFSPCRKEERSGLGVVRIRDRDQASPAHGRPEGLGDAVPVLKAPLKGRF